MANLGNTIVNGILRVNDTIKAGTVDADELNGTATKAIGDKNGNDITTTYVKLSGDQTITGVKTFNTTSGFKYSAIETAGGNFARPVWFNHSETTGIPVINASKFTYNPSTDVLKVGSITGSAAKLTTPRKINGVDFDGSADINIDGAHIIVNSVGTEYASRSKLQFIGATVTDVPNSDITKVEISTLDSTKLPLAGGTMTGPIKSAKTSSWVDGFKGDKSLISSTAGNGDFVSLFSKQSTNGRFQFYAYSATAGVSYESETNITAGTNQPDFKIEMNESGSLIAMKNTQNIGSSSTPWNDVYANNFIGNASTATTLETARTIDGVSFDGSSAITHYGTCSTAAGTAAKTVDCAGFTLVTGAVIYVRFTVTNSAAVADLTLNVNGTGAKAMKYRNGNIWSAGGLASGRTYCFIYDGTYYQFVGDRDANDNTYDRIKYAQNIKAGTTAIVAANLIVASPTDQTYTHLKLGNAFDITKPILYAAGAISASGTGNNNYTCIPFTVTTTQSMTLTQYKPVYIKGTLNGTIFTPISAACLTQAVPATADGYQYILVGTAYSTTAIYLEPYHPIFEYSNGKFQKYGSASANVSNGFGVGVCDTASSTTAKTVTMANYNLVKGGIVSISFTNGIIGSSATLNINDQGAKSITHHGQLNISNLINSGDVVTFIYDGTYYKIISIDKFPVISAEGLTIDWDTYTYPNGYVEGEWASRTDGGSNNFTNLAVIGKSSRITLKTIRTAGTNDFIQVMEQLVASTKTLYRRYCVNGTWSSWVTVSVNGVAQNATSAVSASTATTATNANNIKITETNPTTGTWYFPTWVTGSSGNLTNNVNDGFKYYSLQGTASADGRSIIQAGNNVASGTAGNKFGEIWIYGKNTGRVQLTYDNDTTSNTNQIFPATSGTILNTGTTSFTRNQTTGKKIGSIKINNSSTDIYAPIDSSDSSVTNVVAMTSAEYETSSSSLANGSLVAITDGYEGKVTTQATSLTCNLPLDL